MKKAKTSGRTCDVIIPRLFDVTFKSSCDYEPVYLGECILKQYHKGPHEIVTPDGKRFGWKDDFDGCEDCVSEDSMDRCFIYWEINP
jgi:hypothetical protein